MRNISKRLLLFFLMVILVISGLPQRSYAIAYDPESSYQNLPARFWEDKQPDIGFYINASSRYILETVTAPEMGSTFGEWSVMDLLRGMYTEYDYINYIPTNYFEDYLTRIEAYVTEKNGNLSRSKSTEWARLILALSALGYDIRDVSGHDFVDALSKSYRFSYNQGINGPIWEIISMNTGAYEFYEDATNPDVNTFGKMLDYILSKEITQPDGTVGGWALSGNNPDPDITGMALQGLAPYYLDSVKYSNSGANTSYSEFQSAVERAIKVLEEKQLPNGGFKSTGTTNSESIVQVIVALTALQMDPLASSIYLPNIGQSVSFITEGGFEDGVWSNNLVDALLTFWANGSGSSPEVGGFKHVTAGYDGGGGSGTAVNAMATDQALYGLIAYDRYKKGLNSLYDMSDMINGEYKQMSATTHSAQFDIDGQITSQNVSPYALISMPQLNSELSSWNTLPDGSGTSYLPGEKLIMPEHSITLYAIEAGESVVSDAAISRVLEQIEELPSEETITREHANLVSTARTAYNRLNAEEKLAISNLSKLVLLEGKINELLAQYDDDLKVTNLIQTINSLSEINDINSDYEIAIDNARLAYNNLTASQRLQITNLSTLESLEAKLVLSKTDEKIADTTADVDWLISYLPSLATVTLADKLEIRKVRLQYDALSADVKMLVKEYDKLVALEEKIQKLEKGALETEELEDEIDSNQYANLTLQGKTLIVESDKSAGNFAVELAYKDYQEAIKTASISSLKLQDQRGVAVKINIADLNQELKLVKNPEKIEVSVSQITTKDQMFEVDFTAVKKDGKKESILLNDSYIEYTIPYSFFVSGKNLKEKVLFKVANAEHVSVPHSSKEKHIILKVKQAEQLIFKDALVDFKDVASSSYAQDIYYLANRGVVKGKSEGIYAPNDSITRAQFAVMIARALNLQVSGDNTKIKDIRGKWYEQEVQAVLEAGIANGTSATTFNPEAKLSRQQAASLMAGVLRYAQFNTETIDGNIQFKDINKIAGYAREDIGILNTLSIMTGSASGEFSPTANLTRGQMAKILKRTLNIAEIM